MTGNREQSAIWVLLIVITLIGGWMRFTGLGDLGFFGDEETTSFAARALAEGHGAVMPSGMPYRRALPITWLSAGVARQIGLDAELSYRVFPALLGALAIPLIFLAGRHLAGTGAGFIAALLLAFSGWHMVWSRTARMYAPLVTALVAFFYLVVLWKETGRSRYLVGAAVAYLVGVLLHRAGVAVVLFPILLATMSNGDEVNSRDAIVIAVFLGFIGLFVGDLFITTPFNEWANVYSSLPGMGETASAEAPSLLPWFLGLAGAVAGCIWAWKTNRQLPEETRQPLRLALAVTAVLTATAGCSGWLWAACTLGLCWLILIRFVPSQKWILPGLAVTGAIAAGTLIGTLLQLAEHDWAIRSIAYSPFPYVPYLGRLLPTLVLGFVAVSGALILARPKYGDQALRASIIFVWVYALLVGFDLSYAPWRYLLPMYPWIILTVAAGLSWGVDVVVARYSKPGIRTAAYLGISAVILAGGIGGHGLPAASQVLAVDYGQRVPWYDQGLIGRPDHRGAGLFVRERLAPGDVVIAEDPLQQRWYVGQTDFWFRSMEDAGRYLRLDDEGFLRDIYVWSRLLPDPPSRDWFASQDQSVWFITSLETAVRRDLYLEEDQIRWLEKIEAEQPAAFVGRDGQTRVFCFGACPNATRADPET